MPAHTEFLKKNEQYTATFGDKGALPLKPGKKLAIGESSGLSSQYAERLTGLGSDMHGRADQVRSAKDRFFCQLTVFE